MSEETQQHIYQQSRIHLPAHGVGTMTENAAELEALLYLLENSRGA